MDIIEDWTIIKKAVKQKQQQQKRTKNMTTASERAHGKLSIYLYWQHR